MTETWKPVPEWETLYEVSDLGRVRSLDRLVRQKTRSGNWHMQPYYSKVLTPRTGGGRKKGDRYRLVSLAKDNRPVNAYIHHLVAAAFLGPKPKGTEINHKDCDKTNNALSNLEYVSRGENIAHALANGKGRWCSS